MIETSDEELAVLVAQARREFIGQLVRAVVVELVFLIFVETTFPRVPLVVLVAIWVLSIVFAAVLLELKDHQVEELHRAAREDRP